MPFYNESLRQRHTETCLVKKKLALYILPVIPQCEKHTKNLSYLKRPKHFANVWTDLFCDILLSRIGPMNLNNDFVSS